MTFKSLLRRIKPLIRQNILNSQKTYESESTHVFFFYKLIFRIEYGKLSLSKGDTLVPTLEDKIN